VDAARYGKCMDFCDTLLSENGVTSCDLNLFASFLNSEKECSYVR